MTAKPSTRTMANVVVAVVYSATRLQFASATIQSDCESGWQPQWQRCVEVVLTKSSDPVQVVEQLCGGADADPSVIVVSQLELRSMLLRRYAHDTIILVDETAREPNRRNGRKQPAIWWPFVPNAWEAATKQNWRVADMLYTYARRIHLEELGVPPSGSGLFDRYRYVPVGAENEEARNEKRQQAVCGLNAGDA